MERLLKLVRSNYLFLIGFFLSAILLWPLFKAPYFTHHDDVQVIRLFEMNECIKDFQIPCRWVPNLGGLYGYPLFNYYGPLPYYFGEVIYLITHSFLISAKVMFGFSFLGSYVFMYLLGRKLWGERGALVSGLFYSYAPYHAVDFYVRGAMGEMWALIFFPAIFYFLLRLKEKQNIKNSLGLGISIALLIVSHNISALIFLPIVLAAVLLFFFTTKNGKLLQLSLFAVFLALLLSAFYFLPAFLEKNLVHVDTTTMGYFSYTEHFKGLRKLFFDRTWGWGASIRELPGGEKDGMSFQIGMIHSVVWLFVVIASFIYRKKNKFLFYFVIFCSLITVFAIFMIHPRSLPVWKIIEPIKYLQFPWRFLMFIIFFISVISGGLIYYLKNSFNHLVFIVLVISVVVSNFYFFRPEKFKYINDNEYLNGLNWDTQIKRSIFDYLPIYAKAPPAELATVDYEILEGTAEIKNYKEGSNWFSFDALVNEDSEIKLSKYYFPNWRVYVDGREVETSHSNDLGLITLKIEKGSHLIRGKLYDTSLRSIANFLSLIGLGFVLFVYKKDDAKKI